MVQANHDGLPDYRAVGRHAVFPHADHDQTERFNSLARLNWHLASTVFIENQ